jgi:hypothetical protein
MSAGCELLEDGVYRFGSTTKSDKYFLAYVPFDVLEPTTEVYVKELLVKSKRGQ